MKATGRTSRSPATLGEALLLRAAELPDQLAFAEGETELSFAQLAERASARAGALRRADVQQGHHVAVVMSAGLRFVEVFWALQLVGGVPCALDPSLPAATLKSRIERIRPALVITDESAQELAGGPGAGRPTFRPQRSGVSAADIGDFRRASRGDDLAPLGARVPGGPRIRS